MKKLSVLILITISLFSCNKKYSYIEIVNEKDLIYNSYSKKEKDAISINAFSDSAAYLMAYKKFCISVKANEEVNKLGGTTNSYPVEFKLLNPEGIDISSINFQSKNDQENKILSEVTNVKLDGNKIESKTDNIQEPSIDYIKIRELIKYFNIEKDEFSSNNKIWYTPKSAPKYSNANGIYCYFQTSNNIPSSLRFRIQYYSDEWLFFYKIQFSIDDKAFEYIPRITKTDSGNGGYIWEWFDEPLDKSDMELLNSLADSEKAKMKFIGDKYHDVKTISKAQIVDIKRTLSLYRAMGGKI